MIQNTIFFHGWGYDCTFWQKFSSRISGEHVFYDRGYFHKPYMPKIDPKLYHVVTHSMGLFFLTHNYDVHDFLSLTIYGGFTKFPQQSALRMMRKSLAQDPLRTLKNFYEQCGYNPDIADHHILNHTQLADDLEMLANYDITNQLKGISYTAYHGEFDSIVTIPLRGAIILPQTGHSCTLI